MLTRKEIIKALQNYSEEIEGKTPGEKNFYENTNVGIMDRRRYWPNYGELVKDARLTPNKFDNTKYSKEELCKLFIKTIREQKKWPTRGILEVEHHKDPTFPDSTTFYKRLGNVKTGDLALKIIEYVKGKRGCKAIIDICQPFLKKTGEQEEALPIDEGFVYLLKSTLRNRVAYKIGRTKDIENRRKQLRQPSNIEEVLHYIKTDDSVGVEKYWHNRFKQKRLYPKKPKNEWFKLGPSDVKAFKRWKRIF